MKITSFDLVITPPAGTEVAGYGPHDESWEIHDDLMLNGLLMEHNGEKAALLGFDLIGLDSVLVKAIRKGCAEAFGTEEKSVILSCTHTHGGPHTRTHPHHPRLEPYCTELVQMVIAAFRKAMEGTWKEADVYFYSSQAKVNISRRYCGPENVCRTLFTHRYLEPLSDGITDPEVGMLFFRDTATRQPIEVIVNYAAHPLASHCRGLGGHAVTADYPAMIRKIVVENTQAHCIFVSGACGDQFPIDSEIGWQNLDTIAKPIAREVLHGMVDAFENPQKFKVDPELKTMIAPFNAGIRKEFPMDARRVEHRNVSEYKMELQLLAIGPICFVGVPGELLTGPGLEIKWHSPFRKAFVLYNSTGYTGYICPVNALVAGGYEPGEQEIEDRAALKLVNTAVEAMFELRDNYGSRK